MDKVIVLTPIEMLPKEQQDHLFELSHTRNVYCKDANGQLWQVIDMTQKQDIKTEDK